MKFSAIVFTMMLLITTGFAYTENPVLVEMPMTENWSALPDTRDINVIWFSDDTAILAVTSEGLALLDNHSIKFDTLGEMLPDRHYYIVGARENAIRETWSGVQLVTGHYLVNVSTDTVMPYRRDMYYQRLWPSRRTISALIPPVYERYGSREYNPIIQGFVDQVSETTIYDLLVQMVSYNTRYSYAPELLDAVDWAVDEFETWGYDVELRPHTSQMAPNIIATKTGMVNPDRIWVVGGHFDSTSGQPNTLAPGANDNGTGSALTMHTAEILKDMVFADTVVYALWTGEEQGLYGSAHWAAWAASEGLDIQGYYNFDMIGWEDPAPEDLDVLVNNASFDFGQDFVDVADMYTDLLHDLQVANVSASDHYSFWQNGYVAFCGIEDYWPGYPYYHTVNDTVDKVATNFTAEVTKAMVANVCVAAQLFEAVSIQQPKVNCNSVMDIFVVDFDASGTLSVDVFSNTEPTPETVVLTETASNMFEGSIQVTDDPPVPGDNRISVTHGDIITAYYSSIDEDAHVEVDCVPPVISDISVTSVTADSFTVTWQTDELADSIVQWGNVMPPGNITSNSSITTSHSVRVTDLHDDTQYFFMVKSNDLAGNTGLDDNNGSYYSVTTLQTLWNQPVSGSNPSRRSNQVFPSSQYSGYTSYLADDFVNAETWLISEIFVPGELYNGGTSLANTETLHWRIYADNNGLPAGYPGSGSAPFWSLDLEPDSVQVLLFNGLQDNLSDTGLALETPVQLPAGTWWLMFYPTMSFSPYGQFGRISSDTTNGSVGKYINPGGSFGHGTNWMNWNNVSEVTHHDISFRISGSIPGQATPTPAPPTPTPTQDCINHGDVNFDGAITAADAQLAFQIALGLYTPSYEEECGADCNGDSIVTASDAQQIFLTALGSATCVDPL
jgi:hypothetical protein